MPGGDAALGPRFGNADPHADRPAAFLERAETPEAERSPKPKAPAVSADVAHAIDDLKTALDRTKKKLDRSRQNETTLAEQVKAKAEQLDELQRAAQRAEAERIRQLERAAEAAKRAKAKHGGHKVRRALVAHLEEEDTVGGDLLDEDAYSDAGSEEAHRTGCALCVHQLRVGVRRLRKRVAAVLGWFWLLHADTQWIQTRFGSSVAVYFVYSEWLVNLAFANAVLWLALHVVAAVEYASGGAPSTPDLLSGVLAYLPPDLFRYSSYGGSPYGTSKTVSLLYGLTVMAYAIWYIVSALHRASYETKASAERRIVHSGQTSLFARQVLISWDVSTNSAAALKAHQHATLSNLRVLLYEVEWRTKMKARSDDERWRLFVRQAVMLSLHVLLQLSVYTLIILVQIRSTEIDRLARDATGSSLVASLTTVVVYSTLIELMPLACPFLADACQWDNPAYTRMHKVIGYYAGYVIGLLVLGASELGLLLQWYETAPSLDGTVANGSASSASTVLGSLLYRVGREPDASSFVCGQDQLANKFVQQVLLGFITPKLFELLTVASNWLLHVQLRGKPWLKTPLKIEKKFIRNVYFQGLLWIAVPYLPLMTLIMPIMLYLEFKFDKLFLVRYCSKETAPFKAEFGTFIVFHGLTLTVFVALWVFFFLRTNFATARCGAFYDTAAATSYEASHYIYSRAVAGNGWIGDLVTYTLDNVYLLWLAIFYLIYANSDHKYRAGRLQEHNEDLAAIEAAEKLKLTTKAEALEKDAAKWKKKCQQMTQEQAQQ